MRTILGVQGDGTVGVQAVNGPPPPQPSDPIVASVLGGVTVSWDGTFTAGAVIPMDWQRVEVHAAITPAYDPVPATLQGTIETAQGATFVVACDAPVYVRLVARNTSGAASPASGTVGPFGPTPVVADDILDGVITTAKLADDAVTAAKVATAAINVDALAAAAVTAAAIAADAVTTAAIAAGAVGSDELTASAVTAAKIAAGAVIAGKLDANSVVAGNIAAAAVQAGNLAANSVQAGNLAADSVQAGNVAANAITARELTALAVTAGKIAANAVTAGTIAAGAVTATSLTVGISDSLSQKLTDAMGDASVWTTAADTGTWAVVTGVTDASAGSTVIQASGKTSIERTTNTPFDPDTLYRITARIRTTTAPTSGTPTIYIGLTGVAADGTTRVNVSGSNSVNSQHYVAAANQTIAVGTTWTTVTGYVKGTAATGTGTASTDPKAPGQMHSSTRYIRPLLRLLFGSTAGGVMQVDQVTLETVSTGVVNNVNISDGAITAAKIQAGAVDATALSATAITGKTITGGTITGALIQTAASGEHITLNEANANKVLVYNAANQAINELSARGLLVQGTNGAQIWVDPNNTFPNLRLTNAAQTNSAIINVSSVNSVLGLNSGLFTGSSFSDMKWRTIFGNDTTNDYWVAERVRDSSGTTTIGGRIALSATGASIGYSNSTDTTQNNILSLYAGVAQLIKGRMEIYPPASSNSGLYVQPDTGHTGNLLRLNLGGDKLVVDKDGNTTIAGSLTVTGVGNRQPKRRTTNATKTTTTLGSDGFLTWTVDANAVYAIDGILFYSGPGDFQMGWAIPSGAAGTWQGIGNGTTVVSGTGGGGTQQDTVSTWGYTVRTETTDIGDPRTYGGISTNIFAVQVSGTLRVGATGGTFALQWAQGSTNATGTILYTDSRIALEKVP
ncbi:hypothetical protein ACWC4D_33650 [Streptomyces sp. NPDC001288]